MISPHASRLRAALAAHRGPVLATLLALAVPLGLAGGTKGSSGLVHGRQAATGQEPKTPPSQEPKPPGPEPKPVPRPLFRIVGCRSRGASAYLRGPYVHSVAIGFDDGPWPDTPAFVSMLERAHATATFFMIGSQVTSGYRSLLLRELRDGDVLGDHSFTHPNLAASGAVRGQLQSTIARIRSVSGYTPCVFRPPYGAYNSSVVRTARSLGLATIVWSVDPRDWARPGTGAIQQRVLSQVGPGAIILSHDGGGPRGQTLAAYPGIIAALHRRGYRIVSIPKLLGFRPVYRPCIKLCQGIGVPRSRLPRNAIVEKAR